MALGDETMKAGRVIASVLMTVMLWTTVSGGQKIVTPQRIISIVPAVTEMLFATGSGREVVAVSSFDLSPQAALLPRVGALLDPDMERIFSLKPDLVVLYGSQVEQQRQLSRALVPVFSYRHGNLAHVTSTIRLLGSQTGRPRQANKLAAEIELELASLQRRVDGRPRPRTLLVFGREPDTIRNVYASGGTGFLHDMLETAGGENVFASVGREAAHPSTETILAAAPEVIIELRAENTTENKIAQETRAWQQLSALPAVRSGRVYVLTGDDLVVPGPRVATVTRQLARLLHPDVF